MKTFWHTGTLFIQWGKYKWACKYDHCIECLWVSFKHKWKWLCTSCWDKKRANDPNRIETRKKASTKWHTINKPRKPRSEWAKMWPKPTWFDQKAYQKEWYENNKVYITTIKKWKEWQSKWILCISYRGYPLPLQDLDKPKIVVSRIDDEWTQKALNDWKERMKLFDIMRIYIDKKLDKKTK